MKGFTQMLNDGIMVAQTLDNDKVVGGGMDGENWL
jgi:hypothetical protein